MLTHGHIIALATSLLSFQYNLSQLWYGYEAAKDKFHALICMLPYFQLNLMIYLASKYSQFWDEYPLLFIFYIGVLITNMTGNLNVKGCAGMKYNPIYADPFLFVIILYLDHTRSLSRDTIGGLYIWLCVQRLVLYFSFLSSVISQLCVYLDIPFLMTKQQWESKKKK